MPFFDGADESNLEFKPLPVRADNGAPEKAIYLVESVAKYKQSQAGNPMVNVTFTVEEPEEFAGRKIFDRLMFSREKFKSGNGCALDITFSKLKGAFGEDWVMTLDGDLIEDIIPAIEEKLTDTQLAVKVGQRTGQDEDGNDRLENVIRKYLPVSDYEGVA